MAVVGSGPGGSTTARYLARRGLSVVLIDRDTFPRDKPCGGGFSESIMREFPYLAARQKEFLQGVARVGVLHSPNRMIVLKGRVDMALALRTDFDHVLHEFAIEAGANPLLGKRVKDVLFKDDHVTVSLSDGSTLDSRFIVGADGANSIVARKADLHRRWDPSAITACRVAEIPAPTEDILGRYTEDLHYHFFANLGGLPGYGWIFPKRETINVGLGIVGTHAEGLPRMFDSFVRYLKRSRLLPDSPDLSRARGALVPTGGPISHTTKGRCLLVGDSAGMVSPLTGGGIGYAMKAARYAAGVITKAIEHDDPTTAGIYDRLWYSDFGHEFEQQLLAQRIFTSSYTDLLFEIGSRDGRIQEMVSEAMSETSDQELDVKRLVARTLLVCLRSALHL